MAETDITNETAGIRGRARRMLAAEVGAFLLLILPSLVLGALLRTPRSVGFAVTAVTTIAQDTGLVALVLYFLWRNGEPLRRLGWNFGGGVREVLVGIVLFGPIAFATSALATWLTKLGLSAPSGEISFLAPAGAGELALGVLLVAVVAVAEETIFRGYLLLRFGALTRSTEAAVILSSIVFGLGHGYEGSAGMVSVAVLGALYALVYVWRQSLIAPIVMHFLQDLLGIVIPNIGGS
ncbi:MAG TPA: type II CAAX endopeptidase family protein [Gammaproteobacteria bacterium]|nr:type II CAAX endopeptidase family protein [Gammaproteobacteria bacterium]